MSAAPADDFLELEMDNPTAHRAPTPEPVETVELDLTDTQGARCAECGKLGRVNERSVCQECYAVPLGALFDAPTTLIGALQEIATAGAANAAVTGIGSMAGGQLQGVGFTSRDGYIGAIRNGVPNHTYQAYMTTLRSRYGMTTADINALNLPGPMAVTALPEGKGITHMPTGPSVFDRPRAERAFVVAPQQAPVERQDVTLKTTELVAGAVAEGHHAIVAWEGTSGTTRGELHAALTKIGREAWAPKAPNARAQAGSAIAALSRNGLQVKPLNKTMDGAGMDAGEHVWTVGRVRHTGAVGDQYGQVVVRFRLRGAVLSYEGDAALGDPVVAAYNARMSSEVFKSSDVTGWLSRTIRWRLDGVRFGALGWLVPAVNVDAAKKLCDAVRSTGFGAGWVTGLPVATSDQLRDGIVRGLTDEILEVHNRIALERREAYEAQVAALNAAHEISHKGGDNFEAQAKAMRMPGDITETRAQTHLKELRAIAARVVAYGQILGEARVESAQRTVRDAVTALEGIAGDDFQGIRARFAAVWDEIELDRKRTGGVL